MAVFSAIGLARHGYAALLPAMQLSLGMSNAQAGLLATANLVGYLALSALGGLMATGWGPRRVVAMGLAVAGVGMLLTGTARGLFAAAAWRALTGIGSGAANMAAMGMLSAWFAKRRRGFASGVAVGGTSLALIFTSFVVPRLQSLGGLGTWRLSWYIYGGLALIAAVLAAIFVRNRPADLGLEPIGAPSDPGPRGAVNEDPFRLSRVYRSAAVWHLGSVYAAYGFSYVIYMTFFVKYLLAWGYTQQAASSLFGTLGWFSLSSGLLWGAISDAIGRKRALAIVYVIHAAAYCLFAASQTRFGLTVSVILFGLSAWSTPSIVAAACGDMLGSRSAPAVLGFATLFFGIGQALGPVLAGMMADASGSFAPAFLLAAGVTAIGAIGAATLQIRRQ